MSLLGAITENFPAVISFVGAGGKTSALLRIAFEVSEAGLTAVLTTTTKIAASQLDGHPVVFARSNSVACTPEELLQAALERVETYPVLFAVDHVEGEKAIGLDPGTIDHLANHFDVIVVEADGARGRSLKVPGDSEPVWPLSTTCAVAVVGIDALGQALSADIAHRLEQVVELTGLQVGEMIDPLIIVDCLLHPQGMFRGAPEAAERVVLLNKVTSEFLTEAHAVENLLRAMDPSIRVVTADVRPKKLHIWT